MGHLDSAAQSGESSPIPTLEEFLHAPLDEVRHVAPATMILGTGGTRRRAVLEGISPHSEAYSQLTREQMICCLDLIFQHGVQHLITAMLVSSHNQEVTPGYHDRMIEWVVWALAGSQTLADYQRLGWRVRLLGTESWPDLAPVAERLYAATATATGPTLWFTVASRVDLAWERILRIARQQGLTSRRDLVRAVYGEDIPPATLYLGAGKPQVDESIVLPLLIGKLECYWRQHLGFDLDERTLRTVLYDYAYIRPTWRADKTGRAEQVLAYRAAWEQPPVVGLGTRLGPFWYPAPIPPPPEA